MRYVISILLGLLGVCISFYGHAHAGHGVTLSTNVMHYFLEPMHIGAVILVGVLFVALRLILRRSVSC
jgi:hypothetical protein